jgi:hypothetical protein
MIYKVQENVEGPVIFTISNGSVFEIREVDAMQVLGRQAVLCSGIALLILLKTIRVRQ